MKFKQWLDDTIEIHLENGNIYRLVFDDKILGVYGNESSWISGLIITKVIKADQETRETYERFPKYSLDPNEVSKIKNLFTK